jgi:hypothetical protein
MDADSRAGDTGEEEQLVAELELLGVLYLSRRTPDHAERVREPDVLLADLVRQPSARVRAAVIAVLLVHPDYAEAVPAALERLRPAEQRLPDRFAADLGLLPATSPRERLAALGQRHRQQTQTVANWAETYGSVVRCLLRSWELEAQWNR